MERELLSLFAAARKAAEAATASQASPDGAEVSRCVDALKKLRAFNINKDLLVSTMVLSDLLLNFIRFFMLYSLRLCPQKNTIIS